MAREERCETCRWWLPESDIEGRGMCELISNRRAGSPPSRADAAAMLEGIAAELYTEPDFGCNQWEANDERD